jgi:phage shock protein PspC (stress-responsive transcriptional regulator)
MSKSKIPVVPDELTKKNLDAYLEKLSAYCQVEFAAGTSPEVIYSRIDPKKRLKMLKFRVDKMYYEYLGISTRMVNLVGVIGGMGTFFVLSVYVVKSQSTNAFVGTVCVALAVSFLGQFIATQLMRRKKEQARKAN